MFDDQEAARKIMATDNPVTQKTIGKSIKGFNKDRWKNAAPKILKTALEAKFAQNEHCKNFLQKTGKRAIGEASPNDNFWGIGISLYDKTVFDQSKWGHNLLGKCLQEIRDSL